MEPAPKPSNTPAVWPLIVADLARGALVPPEHEGLRARFVAACEARDAFGRSKYGLPLTVENGRHPLRDAQDEALDLMAYTRQSYERLNATKGAPRAKRLAAWQLHLAACAVAIMVVAALSEAS